jgi:hypothetical protein
MEQDENRGTKFLRTKKRKIVPKPITKKVMPPRPWDFVSMLIAGLPICYRCEFKDLSATGANLKGKNSSQ